MKRVLFILACVGLSTCTKDIIMPTVPIFSQDDVGSMLTASEDLQLVPLRTYDGSDQAVHPDFISPPVSWGQRLNYLVVTPYPNASTRYENPSLYGGINGVVWGAVPNAPMPLVRPYEGYLSDPDISYDPNTNELVVYYRQASNVDKIFMIRSLDGRLWTKPILVLTTKFSSAISPSIVRMSDGKWNMWTINGATGCNGSSTTTELRRSDDGIVWSTPEKIVIPTNVNQYVWHIDVQWISSRNEFWALFPVKKPGTCATKELYIATSLDGITWNTLPTPILVAGVIPEFKDVVYRSTFSYDETSDMVTFWISGARVNGKRIVWRIATERRLRSELFLNGEVR